MSDDIVHWGDNTRFLFITGDFVIRCDDNECDYDRIVYNSYDYQGDALYLHINENNQWVEFYNFDNLGNTIYFRASLTNDSTGTREVWNRWE